MRKHVFATMTAAQMAVLSLFAVTAPCRLRRRTNLSI